MTRAPAAFLDTNILVYAVSTDPRSARAEALLRERWRTSVQALNAFATVARRKLAWSWPETRAALESFRALADGVEPLDMETHDTALALAEAHGFSVHDALMVAAALRSGAQTLFSEDMQDGASPTG